MGCVKGDGFFLVDMRGPEKKAAPKKKEDGRERIRNTLEEPELEFAPAPDAPYELKVRWAREKLAQYRAIEEEKCKAAEKRKAEGKCKASSESYGSKLLSFDVVHTYADILT